MDDYVCGVCRTARGGRNSGSGTGAAVVQCVRGPPNLSAGSVYSTPRWHQRSTKAALLSRGSLPLYHAELPALREPLAHQQPVMLKGGPQLPQDSR